mgnify:FL=1
MAINTAVYSPKQFELYLALQSSNLGTAEDTSGDFVKLAVTNVEDIDFAGGLIQDRTLRTGQQIMRPTDHFVSEKGSAKNISFEYVVDGELALQKLLQLISEDTSPTATVTTAGNRTPAVYAHGADTGEYATLIVSSPFSSKDRTFHSAVLTSLTLSMSAEASGGRLIASGTFYTGYNVTVGASTATDSGTASETTFVKTIYDCTTKQIGSASSEVDVVCRSFDLTINYPAVRIGYQGGNAEPEGYSRSGEYSASGNISVKYDANSEPSLADFLAGSEKSINFGDGSTINFDLPQVIYTGSSLSFDEEAGTFVDIPFSCVADGSEALYTITAT